MKRLTAMLALGLATLFLAAGPVSAIDVAAEFDMSPTSGPPGTTITAASSCFTEVPGGELDASYGFSPGTATLELIDENSDTVDTASAPANPDGTWELQVTVPDDADTPQDMTVSAYCMLDVADGAQALGGRTVIYADQVFSVTQAPTTTTVAAADVLPADTTAAQPLQVQPSFTG